MGYFDIFSSSKWQCLIVIYVVEIWIYKPEMTILLKKVSIRKKCFNQLSTFKITYYRFKHLGGSLLGAFTVHVYWFSPTSPKLNTGLCPIMNHMYKEHKKQTNIHCMMWVLQMLLYIHKKNCFFYGQEIYYSLNNTYVIRRKKFFQWWSWFYPMMICVHFVDTPYLNALSVFVYAIL
jgi:hypothetical protein